jgi:hypothetical protein
LGYGGAYRAVELTRRRYTGSVATDSFPIDYPDQNRALMARLDFYLFVLVLSSVREFLDPDNFSLICGRSLDYAIDALSDLVQSQEVGS